jgi:hypothetical protein
MPSRKGFTALNRRQASTKDVRLCGLDIRAEGSLTSLRYRLVRLGRRRKRIHWSTTLLTDDRCAGRMIDSKHNEASPIANDNIRWSREFDGDRIR